MASAMGSIPSIVLLPSIFFKADINAPGLCVRRTASASAINSRDDAIIRRVILVIVEATLIAIPNIKNIKTSGRKIIARITLLPPRNLNGLILLIISTVPIDALATAIICMSPFIICAISCAMTADNSSSSKASSSPWVTTTVALDCVRPHANAFSAGLGMIAAIGIGTPAAIA